MKLLSDKEKADYVNAPNTCPFCGSDDIEGRAMDGDGSFITQDINCNSCNAEWKDVYTLTDIDQ